VWIAAVVCGVIAFIVYAVNQPDPFSTPAAGSSTSAPAVVDVQASTPNAGSAAQRLADLDGDTQPVSAYQAALDALAPKCTQDEANIAGLGDAGYNDLVKNGVTDETRLTVLQHLDASMPSSLGKTDCTSILSAYLVLREQG
jgi:hypothetical protein